MHWLSPFGFISRWVDRRIAAAIKDERALWRAALDQEATIRAASDQIADARVGDALKRWRENA